MAGSLRPELVFYCAISGTRARIHNKADSKSSRQSVSHLLSQLAGLSVGTLPQCMHVAYQVLANRSSITHPALSCRPWVTHPNAPAGMPRPGTESSFRTTRKQQHRHPSWMAVPFILMSFQAQPPQPVAVCSSLSSIRVPSTVWNVTLFRLFPRQMSPPSVILAKLLRPPSSAGGALRRVHLNMPHDHVRDFSMLLWCGVHQSEERRTWGSPDWVPFIQHHHLSDLLLVPCPRRVTERLALPAGCH